MKSDKTEMESKYSLMSLCEKCEEGCIDTEDENMEIWKYTEGVGLITPRTSRRDGLKYWKIVNLRPAAGVKNRK